jgi:hypothetical protein
MTLQDLGNLGELISAIAVVISLAYLAVQIRQNTKTVRTSTYQAVLDSSRSDTELILAHPHLERIYRVGRRDPNELTDEERPLFRMLLGQLLVNHEIMFLHYRQGVVDEDFWRGRQLGLRAFLSQPGVRHYWKGPSLVRQYYGTKFQELVESILDEDTARDEPATFHEDGPVKPSSS